MSGSVPSVWRAVSLNRPVVEPDPPGIRRGGSLEDQEHRRRILAEISKLQGYLSATKPEDTVSTAAVTASSASWAEVLSTSWLSPGVGPVAVTGALYAEEVTSGSLGVRITVDSASVWSRTIQNQAALLLEPSPQLSKWQVPLGSPALFNATTKGALYAIALEIQAPAGSYAAAAGAWITVALRPQEVG